MKNLLFMGTARADLQAFPREVRKLAGMQLDLVQNGHMPTDWKPMPSIGHGVVEIRIRAPNGAFRIIYVANIAEDVLVLHCFQKKSSRTSRGDIALAAARLKAFLRRGNP